MSKAIISPCLKDYFLHSDSFFYFLSDAGNQNIFCNPFFTGAKCPGGFDSLFKEPVYLFSLMNKARETAGTIQAELECRNADGDWMRASWEFSACQHGDSNEIMVQAIGFPLPPFSAKLGVLSGRLAKLFKAFEQSTEGVWRFDSEPPVAVHQDADSIIRHWKEKSYLADCNDNMARMYGYEKAEDLIGSRLHQLIDFSDEDRVDNFRKFIRNGFRTTLVETREFDRYGNVKYFLNSMEAVVVNGLLQSVWGTQQDITGLRQAEEKIRYLALLMENVSDIIISQDKDLHIVTWNKAAEDIYGFSADEMIGHTIPEMLHFDLQDISRDEFFNILHQQGIWRGEANVVNRFGVPLTILSTVSTLKDPEGRLTGYLSVSKDITEKKRAEEKLRESELFYRNLFVHSLDGVLITDPGGVVKFASPSVTTIFGYTPKEIIGRTTFEFTHPEDRALAEEAFMAELTHTPRLPYISVRIKDKKGNWVWCIVRGHNLMDNPYIKGMVVYLYDDTLRKQTEQALRESKQRFRAQAKLLSNVTDVIVTIDMNRVVTSWNNVAEKLTGISAEFAVGKPYREVIKTSYHPFTNEQVFSIVQQEGIWRGEISFTGFDGETKYLLHTISLIRDEEGETGGMMGVGKDITERKSMEAQLQQSENFYRSLAANSLDGIVLTDTSGKLIYCGPSVPHISGYKVLDMLGNNFLDFVHPDDHKLALKAFAMEVKKESQINYVVMRLRHATLGWVWCTVRGHNLLHDPILKGIVIYFTDDTKRKMIEDQLRESERRFRNLIHDLKLGVILQNENSEMLVCNKAALDLLGVTEDQLLGRTSFDPRWNVIHEDGSAFPAAEHPVPMAIRLQQPVRDVVMGVYRPLTQDRVWLLVNADPVFDGENKLINVVCTFTDITEQRRLAQQLTEQEIQKQKLITQATIDGQEKERLEIGKELHDNINQHLTTTRLYLEVARDKITGPSRDMIDLAEKNLAEIVKQIRFMSQSLVPPTLGDIGLIESIQDLCDSLRMTHSFAINFLHQDFDETGIPENMKLMIFRIIQEQVNNVIRHARASHLLISLCSDRTAIRFSIRDDGQGFDPQQHKKGMGLKNIINRAALFEGRVSIISQPGQGCEVSVELPPLKVPN